MQEIHKVALDNTLDNLSPAAIKTLVGIWILSGPQS